MQKKNSGTHLRPTIKCVYFTSQNFIGMICQT